MPTAWGTFSLLEATRHMFQTALTAGAMHMLLLSGDTVPLHRTPAHTAARIPFHHSLINIQRAERCHSQRKFTTNISKLQWPTFKWKFHSQWCMLLRKHVLLLEEHWDSINTVFKDSEIPDEHVFGTFLISMGEHRHIQTSPPFMYVGNIQNDVCPYGTLHHTWPTTYHNLTPALISEYKETGSLFLRKVCIAPPDHIWSSITTDIETVSFFQHTHCETCPKTLLTCKIFFITSHCQKYRKQYILDELHRLGLCNSSIGYYHAMKPPKASCWYLHREVAIYCQEHCYDPYIVLEDDVAFNISPDRIVTVLNEYLQICKSDLLLLGNFTTGTYISHTGFMKWLVHGDISKQYVTEYTFPMIYRQIWYVENNTENNNPNWYMIVIAMTMTISLFIATVCILCIPRLRKNVYVSVLMLCLSIPICTICSIFLVRSGNGWNAPIL
jgi:hypothetical protein